MKQFDLRGIVTPDNINTSSNFWGSEFGNSEAELVARSLITAMKKKGIKFSDWFTYEDVKANVSDKRHMNYIDEYLERDTSASETKYRVSPEFVRIVLRFANKGEKNEKI